jgi:superfamily II DNA or RNA helicase
MPKVFTKVADALPKKAAEARSAGRPYVERVDSQTAREWYARLHYSGTAGNGQIGRFGYFNETSAMLAIVSFGNPTNVHGLAKKLELSDWRGNVELSRLAVHPDAPKNTATTAIAASLDQLADEGYEWCFSYADTGQGHHGGIYQAMNSVYVGRSPGVVLYLMDGKRLHNRNAVERWGSNRFPHKSGERCPGATCQYRRCVGFLAATKDGVDLQKDWQGSSDKHTYILVVTKNKRDRKALRDHLEQYSLPYPKRDGVGDATKRAGVSGENDPATSRGSQGQSLDPAPPAVASRENGAASGGASPGQNRGTARLYPYQRAGSAFLATTRSALLADEMGTGKTPQTIRALQLLAAVGESVLPALVVCPSSVKSVWAREFAKWWPGCRVAVPRPGTASAEAAIREAPDVLVINYESLPNLSRLAPYGSIRLEGCTNCDPLSSRTPARCQKERKALNEHAWRTVIADEAHRIKDPKAQQTRALWSVGDEAEFRFALTGSPIANAPDDLWAVMRFVSPAEYARKTAFVDRYVETVPNIWSGFAEPVGFRAESRAEFDRFFLPRFIRRPKSAVLPDLPPKTYMVRDVELSGKQAKAYDDMRKSLVARIDDGAIFAGNPLMELLRLRQFACAFGEADGAGGMRLSEPSSKLDALEDVLAELGDRQAVVFAESRQLIDLAVIRLTEAGRESGLITGAVPEDLRTRWLEAFQAGDLRVLLCTIGAGGVGLDMSAADTAVFLQRSFSAVLNVQAEDRIHRHGQTSDNVTIVDLVAVGTVEDHVREVLEDKAARLEDLVRDAETLRRWLS